MMRRWMLMVAVGLLVATVAEAQVPVGNQPTFGRTGRAFPFLNRHGYSNTFDQGRPIPNGQQHAYGTGSSLFQTDSSPAPQSPSSNGSSITLTSLDTTPTVPLAVKAPGGLIFSSTAGHVFKAPFLPFSGLSTTSPVISTASPTTFQSFSFQR